MNLHTNIDIASNKCKTNGSNTPPPHLAADQTDHTTRLLYKAIKSVPAQMNFQNELDDLQICTERGMNIMSIHRSTKPLKYSIH